MSRPWNLEGLLAVRILAAANAPLGAIGEAVDRFTGEVDQALWALVGRTPEQALARLNGTAAAPPTTHALRPRILTALSLGQATIRTLAAVLNEDPADVAAALAEAAEAGLVDADDPPPPSVRDAMSWRLTRRFFAATAP